MQRRADRALPRQRRTLPQRLEDRQRDRHRAGAPARHHGERAGGLFNGPGGRSITFNIRTLLPAYINESIDAPLTQLHGRYGEKLTLVVPHSLQEILSGVFVGVKDFDVSLTGATRRNGVEYSFLKARRCPKTALHGVFDFKDWPSGQTASTTIDAKVRCRAA